MICMKDEMTITLFLMLICSVSVFSVDRNLVIIIDAMRQETVDTDEINMTHQALTALQQKASMVLMSVSLWKNIIDRKERFFQAIKQPASLESDMFRLYQTTSAYLKQAKYALPLINQQLSHDWFGTHFAQLAQSGLEQLHRIRFDFACYRFVADLNQWKVYAVNQGMLLFVPHTIRCQVDEKYRVTCLQMILQKTDKNLHILGVLEKFFGQTQDRFVIYLTGHGHPKAAKQGAQIAGLSVADFRKFLEYCDQKMHLKLLVYSSCYAGGVHTLEPYVSLQLHFPVIVTAVTDAPIFGFGLFEGVKLPPYDANFYLQSTDVSKKEGLMPFALQDYSLFFKRAWKGYLDLHLIQAISRFFNCDLMSCSLQKIENYPLIRYAKSLVFMPIQENLLIRLVVPITSSYATFVAHKPLFLYVKKIKKIKMDRPVPIVSMLPGLQSHSIDRLHAPFISMSKILTESLISVEDMQGYKNFIVKQVTCLDDIFGKSKTTVWHNLLVCGQDNIKPRGFEKKPAGTMVFVESDDASFGIIVADKKIIETFQLNQDQKIQVAQLLKYVMQMVEYDQNLPAEDLITYDRYKTSKEYHDQIIDMCTKQKVCNKKGVQLAII